MQQSCFQAILQLSTLKPKNHKNHKTKKPKKQFFLFLKAIAFCTAGGNWRWQRWEQLEGGVIGLDVATTPTTVDDDDVANDEDCERDRHSTEECSSAE